MSYSKQTWVNGEVITDTKLNHMEDGIANAGSGSVLLVETTISESGSTLDKTYAEIKEALMKGWAVVQHIVGDNGGDITEDYYNLRNIEKETHSGVDPQPDAYRADFNNETYTASTPDGVLEIIY